MQVLQEYYKQLVENQENYIDICKNSVRIVDEYAECTERVWRVAESIKTNVTQSTREDGTLNQIYIGDILVPLNTEDNLYELVKKMIRRLDEHKLLDEEKDWLKFPLSYSCEKPFVLFVDYSYSDEVIVKNDNRLVPKDLIHAIMYQVMQTMPAYTYAFHYFDPIGAGKDLNEFQRLSSVVNGNAYWLREELFNDTFRILQQAGNVEEMQKQLMDLSTYVNQVNQIRRGESVISYNAASMHDDGTFTDEADIIPQKFLLLENVHGILGQSSLSHIQALIKNARECGISIVIVSKHKANEMLDEYEKQIINESLVDVLEWHSETEDDWYDLSVCGATLGKDEDSKYHYNFQPYGEKNTYDIFLQEICESFTPNLDMETRFEKLIDMDEIWGKSNGEENIEIPISVNLKGKISSIQLGGSSGAHALLTGATGCGKSSLLHTIINGTILKYRPQDVQIWLSDYKSNEFRRYMESTPPHIQYVATDRSMEYSLHFLDKIYAEYQRRIDLFGSITSIKEYREIHGQDSMPRILILIDEFHVMSGHVKDEPVYKSKLTSILREARSVGITMFLADQTCGVGLQGLSEDGRNQLTCRMAMRTTIPEYNAVFDIANAKEVIPTVQPYEIVMRKIKNVVDINGKAENKTYYEHSKTIYIDNKIRDLITKKSIECYGQSGEAEFFVSEKRMNADWNQINLEEEKNPVRKNQFPLYLGVPSDLNKFMRISLMENYGENLMSIGNNPLLQAEILFHVIESIRNRKEAYQILIMAGENDFMFIHCEEQLYRLADQDENIHVISDEEEICRTIMNLEEELTKGGDSEIQEKKCL